MKTIGDFRIVRKKNSYYIGEHKFLKKKCLISPLKESVVKNCEEKIETIAALDHVNLINLHTMFCEGNKYFLVMDYLEDEVSLWKYLCQRDKKFSEREVWEILYQIASVLDYMHEKNVIYGFLNANNISVEDKEGKLFIYVTPKGFLSSFLEEKLSTDCPSFFFLSPEQKLRTSMQFLSDSYSLGVLAYFLIMGYFPDGLFSLPSTEKGMEREWQYDWDFFIQSTMAYNPQHRWGHLGELLHKIDHNRCSTFAQTKQNFLSIISPSLTSLLDKDDHPDPFCFLKDQKVDADSHFSRSTVLHDDEEAKPERFISSNPSVKPYVPKKKEVKSLEPMLTEMVIIEEGWYMRGNKLGARDEKPRHKVYIHRFAVDIHPVTNEQFVRFLDVIGSEKDSYNNYLILLKESRIRKSCGKLLIESGYTKHPVVGITWYGAKGYASWVGKRLPTEAEWEIAASGGVEENIYPYGEDIERSQANFFSSDTTPVMSYPPNDNKLFDMAGNVYNWCEDWYDSNYYETSMQEPVHPKGPDHGIYKVLRGGCWKSLKEYLYVGHRNKNNPGSSNRTYGFRCACDIS